MTAFNNQSFAVVVHPVNLPLFAWIKLTEVVDAYTPQSVARNQDTQISRFITDCLEGVRIENSKVQRAVRLTGLVRDTYRNCHLIDAERAESYLVYFDSGNILTLSFLPLHKNVFLNSQLQGSMTLSDVICLDMYASVLDELRKSDHIQLTQDVLDGSSIKKTWGALGEPGMSLDVNGFHTAFVFHNDLSDTTNLERRTVNVDELDYKNTAGRFRACARNEDARVFLGWSYSLISTGNHMSAMLLLGNIFLAQTIWFHCRSVRARLVGASRNVIITKSSEALKRSEQFNNISLKFHLWENWVDVRRTNTTPNSSEIFEYLWLHWDMDTVTRNISKSFSFVRDFLSLDYQIKIGKQERQQNDLLFILSWIGIFGLFGSVAGYFQLYTYINKPIGQGAALLDNLTTFGLPVVLMVSIAMITIYIYRRLK